MTQATHQRPPAYATRPAQIVLPSRRPLISIDERLVEQTFLWVLLAVYVAIVLFVTLHHEPWRDEADTWLYARDADLATMLGRMPYMGTPSLWYLLLFPLAKSGLPYVAQSLLNVAIATLAVAIVLRKSPFPLSIKGLLIFSYHFGYEWSVVARHYALSALLVVLAASLYAGRHTRPLRYGVVVALLMNTNAHSFFIGGVIAAAYLFECVQQRARSPRQFAALGAMLAGGLAALVQLWPPPDGFITSHAPFFAPLGFLTALLYGFVPTATSWWYLPLPLFVVGATTVALLQRDKLACFILWGSYVSLSYIFVFKYPGSIRHWGFLALTAIFCLWIAYERRAVPAVQTGSAAQARQEWSGRPLKYAIAGLRLCLLLSVAGSSNTWMRDVNFAFSGSKEMAEYLIQQRLTGQVIAAHPLFAAESILPYLKGKRFWYPGLDEFGSFMPWNDAFRRASLLTVAEAESRVRAHFRDRTDVLLLLNQPLPEPLAGEYRLLYETQRPVDFQKDEVFYLYARVP